MNKEQLGNQLLQPLVLLGLIATALLLVACERPRAVEPAGTPPVPFPGRMPVLSQPAPTLIPEVHMGSGTSRTLIVFSENFGADVDELRWLVQNEPGGLPALVKRSHRTQEAYWVGIRLKLRQQINDREKPLTDWWEGKRSYYDAEREHQVQELRHQQYETALAMYEVVNNVIDTYFPSLAETGLKLGQLAAVTDTPTPTPSD